MIPATPQQLAALADTVRGQVPISADSLPDAVRHRTAVYLPNIAARLLAAETALANLRHAVAMHAAREDAGEDVTAGDLLAEAARHGVALGEDVTAAAQTLTAMYAAETRW
ncbi:hypothetical protein [Streptomyces pseudogriseolus]|uniref:hypothetical protein n=1 Tax=Streptomyces pseudogriseolus TaxID=36817 RepID=UPI003FA316C2